MICCTRIIATKDILEGNLDVNLKDDLKLFKEFTSSSNKFVNYINNLEKNNMQIGRAHV